MTDLELTTLVIAIVGAVTGVGGTVLSVMNYRRDRASVQVSITSGYIGGVNEDDFDGPYIFVTAVNKGRRPVSLRSCGLLLPGGHERIGMRPGEPGQPNALSGPLNESDQRQVWVYLDALVGELRHKDELVVPTHGYVDDTTGRRWTGRVPGGTEIAERVARARAGRKRPVT